jgi:hypothetical protein
MNASQYQGKYLYAFTRDQEDLHLLQAGLNKEDAYVISTHGLQAVVSNVPNKRVRPERRNLAAHQEVLKQLVQREITLLPVSFGIIADSHQGVKHILESYRETLSENLDYVQGRVEMGLRVSWDVPNIFEYFVQIHPELRQVRDRVFGRHREPTHEEMIEIGRMFDHCLHEDREAHTSQVEDILDAYCVQIQRNKCAKESEVMHLACLVDRTQMEEFEKGIFEAAELFDNNFTFDYNGPWAPHNFVTLELSL